MADTDTTPTEGEPESTEDTPEPTEDQGTETPDQATETPDDLITKLRAKTRESSKYQKRAQTAEAELTKFKEAQLTVQEKAIKAARDEGKAEGVTLGNQRLIRAEVIAAAAGKVADAEDAYAILTASGTLAGLEVGDDGTVDTAVIKTAIDELVKAKPHLAPVRSPSFGARTPVPAAAKNTDAAMDDWLRSARH